MMPKSLEIHVLLSLEYAQNYLEFRSDLGSRSEIFGIISSALIRESGQHHRIGTPVHGWHVVRPFSTEETTVRWQ